MKKYVVLAVDFTAGKPFFNIVVLQNSIAVKIIGTHLHIEDKFEKYAYKCYDGKQMSGGIGAEDLLPFIDTFYERGMFGDIGSVTVLDDEQADMILKAFNL